MRKTEHSPKQRRATAVLLAVFGVLALLVGQPGTAHAEGEDWAITRYAMVANVAADGTVDVELTFDFDFGDDPGHGPALTQPARQSIPGDPDHYRSFEISEFRATSPTGAPAQVDAETDGGAYQAKIGDPDVEVRGVQTYVVSYRIRGLMNPQVPGSGLDELNWNVISDWDIPISNITVTVNGPAAVDRVACFAGSSGGSQPCTSNSSDGHTAVFGQSQVNAGDGLTVAVGWPAGTFVGAEPILIRRYHLGNTFTPGPAPIGVGAAIGALGAVALLLRARRQGRDQQYAGLTPGLSPASATEHQVTTRTDSPVAVRFTPPDGVRAGQAGTVIDEVAHPRDVTATIVDLAVRGYLRIQEIPADEQKKSGAKPDWQLVRLRAGEDLAGYQKALFDGLFADDGEVTLSEVGPSYAKALAETKTLLYDDVVEQGWFRASPQKVRARWYGIGVLIVLAGVALTAVLAATLGWGLAGLGVVIVGIVTFVVAGRMPARTAAGTALLDQTLGFKLYLETAEADQIRFEEGEDLFSRYLPYAIVFGVAERWAKIFADLAAQGRNIADPTWYVGGYYGTSMLASGQFAENLNAFSTQTTTAMTAATSGSGGGSGFSGGSVGGGVGGGGGGGW